MKYVLAVVVGLLISVQAQAVNEPMWSAVSGSSEWDELIEKSLLGENKDLLDYTPKDAERFCPNFENLKQDERLDLWKQIVSALAQKESDFDEDLTYKEQFKEADGTFIVSRGLLQLSKTSAQNYGCDIDSGSDLEKADANLLCGLRIMKRWVINDKVIAGGKKGAWRGLARYWGPFRTKKLAIIRSNVQAASFCKK